MKLFWGHLQPVPRILQWICQQSIQESVRWNNSIIDFRKRNHHYRVSLAFTKQILTDGNNMVCFVSCSMHTLSKTCSDFWWTRCCLFVMNTLIVFIIKKTHIHPEKLKNVTWWIWLKLSLLPFFLRYRIRFRVKKSWKIDRIALD